MDIKEAFADGPFGSGEPSPHEREPASESTAVDKRDAVDQTVKASEGGASNDHDDDEGGEKERPRDLERALRALDSERSITRGNRKTLKQEAAAKRDLESRYTQAMDRIAALERQGVPPQAKPAEAPKAAELSDDDFYAKGPEYVRQVMAQREQALIQQRFAPLEQRVAMGQIMASEEAWRSTHPDYDEKKAVCQEHMRNSQDLRDEFNRVAAGQHPAYRSIAHFVYEYAQNAERIGKLLEFGDPADIEARLSGGGGNGNSNGSRDRSEQRRAPLTLAGRPGGGASVTPSHRDTALSELAFPNF